MTKQFTDDKKIILTGIDTGYSISDIDYGKFNSKKMQSSDLAEHVSRFTRRYHRVFEETRGGVSHGVTIISAQAKNG